MLKGLRVMFYAGVVLILACCGNRVSGSVVFSLQTSGGLAEGIFYESSLAFSSLCELKKKKK
jgi:hypothetical protein